MGDIAIESSLQSMGDIATESLSLRLSFDHSPAVSVDLVMFQFHVMTLLYTSGRLSSSCEQIGKLPITICISVDKFQTHTYIITILFDSRQNYLTYQTSLICHVASDFPQ